MPDRGWWERAAIRTIELGYVLSLPLCAMAVLTLKTLKIFQYTLWFWSAMVWCYAMYILIRRGGWVPTRGGMREITHPRAAAFLGVLAVALACCGMIVGLFLPKILVLS